MEQSSQPAADTQSEFEAEAQISGKGFGFFNRDGVATIAAGRVTLRNGKGEAVIDVPAAEVWADKARGSFGGVARLWINERKYGLQARSGSRSSGQTLAGGVRNVSRDVQRIKQSKGLVEQFLASLEAAGGHIGKPGGG